MGTNYDGNYVNLIPIHISTRVLISNILRSKIEELEGDLNQYIDSNIFVEQDLNWIKQRRDIIENAKMDLTSIDMV